MPLALSKETKDCYTTLGTASTQLLLEQDFIIPDIKPDAAAILHIHALPVLEEEKAAEGRISFQGVLKLNVLLLTKDEAQPLSSMEEQLPFADFLRMDEVTRATDVVLFCQLSHLEYRLINDRKISCKAILTVTAQSYAPKPMELLTSASGDGLQSKRSFFCQSLQTPWKKEVLALQEQLSLPPQTQLLFASAEVVPSDSKAVLGGIFVSGELAVTLLLASSGGAVESRELSLPFQATIESPSVTEDMTAETCFRLEKLSAYPLGDDLAEETTLQLDGSLCVLCCGHGMEETAYLADAYSISAPIQLETVTQTVLEPVGQTLLHASFPARFLLEAPAESILQLLGVHTCGFLDRCTAQQDGVLTEGAVTLSVLYTTNQTDPPVACWEGTAPFSELVSLPNTQPGDTVTGRLISQWASVRSLNERELEATIHVLLQVSSSRPTLLTAITHLEETEETSAPLPSLVIYVVQPGDTLWQIAKTFAIPLEQVLSLNGLEEETPLYPGQKLLLLRTVFSYPPQAQ